MLRPVTPAFSPLTGGGGNRDRGEENRVALCGGSVAAVNLDGRATLAARELFPDGVAERRQSAAGRRDETGGGCVGATLTPALSLREGDARSRAGRRPRRKAAQPALMR